MHGLAAVRQGDQMHLGQGPMVKSWTQKCCLCNQQPQHNSHASVSPNEKKLAI
jgi:hypothetical protein